MEVQSQYPTDGQVCMALLTAIVTHRDIQNAKVYYPAIVGDRISKEPIRIESTRLFGGLELIEPGLTLAVYPFHSGFTTKNGTISHYNHGKSIYYEEDSVRNTLGRPTSLSSSYREHAVYKVIVQLFYQDATYNAPITIPFDYIKPEYVTKLIPHGRAIQFNDKTYLSSDITPLTERTPRAVQSSSLTVNILPGEEILRNYMPIVRGVIRDIPVLLPFNTVRNPKVLCCDYPTTNWLKDSENIVFHSAYVVVQYDFSEPPRPDDYELPNIQNVLLDDGVEEQYL